jgi:hypothetical protein
MNFLLAIYILAGTVIPMEEKQEYYVICFDNDTAVEYATREEVVNYINTGEFVYFPEGPPKNKGFNYKKHNRKFKRHRWFDRKFRKNICDQYGKSQPVLSW